MMDHAEPRPITPKWVGSRGKRLAARLVFPLVYALNRPAFQSLAELAYDLALRMNGFAINFAGRHGLGYAEERFLARQLANLRDGVLFDVGANHGAYSREMRRLAPGARIHAFEPHPTSFLALRSTLDGAGVTLVNQALSDQCGTMDLHDFADEDGSTQASLSRESVGMYDSRTVRHTVQVDTLDAYMDRHGIDAIDLLKIDTEGFDLHVLRGARNALARGAIKIIQFEVIPADIAMHVTVREFFEVLVRYRLYRLCLNGDLMPLRRYDVKRCEVYVTHNIVAVLRKADDAGVQPGRS